MKTPRKFLFVGGPLDSSYYALSDPYAKMYREHYTQYNCAHGCRDKTQRAIMVWTGYWK